MAETSVPKSKRQAVGITSILDTDLYKLTMQNVVLQRYPNAQVKYRFTNRSSATFPFTRRSVDVLQQLISNLVHVKLTSEERDWLAQTCPYFPPSYLEFLAQFRFDPDQEVTIQFKPFQPPRFCPRTQTEWGEVDMTIQGLWARTILYEIPLLCLVSEVYFVEEVQDWDLQGQVELAKKKWSDLMTAKCQVMEFGTRRRRNFQTQRLVLSTFVNASKEEAQQTSGGGGGGGALVGTSNVLLGKELGVRVVGTMAHELIMGEAALGGYPGVNGRVMELWEDVYPTGQLNTALTDTFSTKPFWEDLMADVDRAKRWSTLRQDSGDPEQFTLQAKQVWEKLGLDPKTGTIVYSDGLSPERCIQLQALCEREGLRCTFGVGTNFTNDFRLTSQPDLENRDGHGSIREGNISKAMNIVIKLSEIDGNPCIKISDELTKNTGDPETVKRVKQLFGLV